MLLIERVLGARSEPALAEQVHRLEHHGAVDIVQLPSADMARRRMRVCTQRGEEIAIALPREETLFDGAVLLLDDRRAIVVRATVERWLRLEPQSVPDAIELGYHAGNLHWRVRFDGEALLVALEGAPDDYLARLGTLVSDRRVASTIVSSASL
ncbi:MAG TPA: urease accessory protein UreE [Ancylobacter sp.]